MSRLVPLVVVVTLLALASSVRADDADPWFGRDKALHFGVSAALASSGYALGTAIFEQRWKAVALGGGVAVGAGGAKELADLAGLGDPSWRDFAWDLAGTAVGLGVAMAIDALVRTDSTQTSASASKLTVRF